MTDTKTTPETPQPVYVNTLMPAEYAQMLDEMVTAYDLDRSKIVRLLIRREYRKFLRNKEVVYKSSLKIA